MQILSLLLVAFAFAGQYDSHLIEIDGFQNRTHALEKRIRDLVSEIKVSKDKAHIQALTQEIVTAHEEIEKNIRRADKIRSHVRFEHPEKGHEFDKKYPRLNKKGLKDLESELGLDKILSQLRRKVEQTFPDSNNTERVEKKDESKSN